MSVAISLSQQSSLADDAYQSLTGAIRGKAGHRSGSAQGREEHDSTCFVDQAWCFGHWGRSANECDQ